MSSALADFWQNAIGPVGGAVIGFLAASAVDAWRGRRRMSVELTGGACFYAHRQAVVELPGSAYATGPVAAVRWTRCRPEDSDATLFIRAELIVANRSAQDDAITQAYLVLGQRSEPGVPRAFASVGQAVFRGENVKAHSIVALTFLFEFDRLNHDQFPMWRYDRDTIYPLFIKTIRHQTLKVDYPPVGWTIAGSYDEVIDARLFEPGLPAR